MATIINLTKAKLHRQIKAFDTTGTIPEYFSEGRYKSKFSSAYLAIDYWKNEFKDKKTQKLLQEIKKQIINFKIEKYHQNKNSFANDYFTLQNTYNSNKADFKFPTVLIKYRPEIHPVRALYYDLQATQLEYDKDNKTHIWFLDLFNNHAWLDNLIESIKFDNENLKRLIKRHASKWKNTNMYMLPVIYHEALAQQKEFDLWIKAFNTMYEYDPNEPLTIIELKNKEG